MTTLTPITLKPRLAGVKLPAHNNTRFSGVQEYQAALSKAGFEVPADVLKANLAQLLTGSFAGDLATAARELGLPYARPLMDETANLNKEVQSFPLGQIRTDKAANKKYILSYDNANGAPDAKEIEIDLTRRSVVCGPETSPEDFKKLAFGPRPKVIMTTVGYTLPNPDLIEEQYPEAFTAKVDELRAEFVDKLGADHPKLPNTDKLRKLAAGAMYEDAFKAFWEPIYQHLYSQPEEGGIGLNPNKLGILASATDDGIDRAATEFGEAHEGISVAHIIPFTYAKYMDPNKPHPLYVTSSVEDYAQGAKKIAGLCVAHGGKDHTLFHDISNFLIEGGGEKYEIPVDLMEHQYGMKLPATRGGKIANASAYMLEKGQSVHGMALAQNQRLAVNLTPTQTAVARVIETLHNRVAGGNPQPVVERYIKQQGLNVTT
jgi:hypothetical protein